MHNKHLKVMTILGTRPEIIRLSRVMQKLDKYVNHIIVHTGQNYDHGLNAVFFDEMRLRKPDYNLAINCSSVGAIYGNILIETEKVIEKEKPDAILILGDTNSSIAGLIAKRRKIPIYHMEAGNRCFDLNVPEEINRKVIDHISDFNLVYTEHARRNLLAEGIQPRRIYLTGSPIKEILDYYAADIESSIALENLNVKAQEYFLASFHREENVDNKANLTSIITALNTLQTEFKIPVIVSTHPRTRKRLIEYGLIDTNSAIRFMEPMGYLAYNKLQKNARCVISDSGTISEESAVLSFPAITIRNAIERPEALDAGTIILTGLNAETIVDAVSQTIGNSNYCQIPAEYAIDNVSERVVKLILGTTKLSNMWNNINKA